MASLNKLLSPFIKNLTKRIPFDEENKSFTHNVVKFLFFQKWQRRKMHGTKNLASVLFLAIPERLQTHQISEPTLIAVDILNVVLGKRVLNLSQCDRLIIDCIAKLPFSLTNRKKLFRK